MLGRRDGASQGTRALLILLDFQTWATARPWTYSASFAVQEGLVANGVECVTVPAIAEQGCATPASWVYHAREALKGQRFDHVWLWLIHTPLDQATLEWVGELAPVRIGILMESLRYDEQDYQWAPKLRARFPELQRQLPYLTHVLTPDERDAAELGALGGPGVLWWPQMVLERFITLPPAAPIRAQAVFHGTPYGRRQAWVGHPALRSRLHCASPADPPSPNQRRFDELQQSAARFLASGEAVTAAAVEEYAQALRTIRLAEFHDWMGHLVEWPAIVNLPSLAKFYGGRVFEGVAAGRPVISWNMPSHPKNMALLEPGRECLLFDADRPDDLAAQIDRVLRDPSYAQSLARQAQDRVRRCHTAERRVREALEWVSQGVMPTYGITEPSKPATPRFEGAGGKTDQNRFYVDLFVNQPAWSTPEPNADESARWTKIASCLEHVLRQSRREQPGRILRILDVGCGRGWLTNLAAGYGTAEGVEPVAGVVDHARRLFPHLRFEVGTPESVLSRPDFVPYDVVLCSEVIEHVPHPQKPAFVAQLAQLLAADGYLILTTPRGEVWEEWRRIAPPNQPIEDWVTEKQLDQLLQDGGFRHLGLERIHIDGRSLRYYPHATPAEQRDMELMPIYQVWACRRSNAAGTAFTRSPTVSVIVPTYNRPDRLRQALDSLNRQKFQDFEVIVVNDGTASVEAVVAESDAIGRMTVVNHDHNRGLAAARNTGLRMARGTYIAYLDDDDRFLPDHLSTLVAFLERGTHRVAYTDAWRIAEREVNGVLAEVGRDQPYGVDFDRARLFVANYIPVLCLMHHRGCLDEVGRFDESLFVHEDWDLWIRLSMRYPFARIARATAEFTWRIDGSSMTSRDQDAFARTADLIYRKYAAHLIGHHQLLAAQQHTLATLKSRASKKAYDCSIIIPVWNNAALTQQCLTALAQVTDGVTYEVVVVDNGSTDGIQDFLKTLGGDVQVICNQDNLGFAKACNQGARAARGEFLVFLNNDTVPLQGWLSALVEEARTHPEVAVVGSKLLYEDGTIQHAGVAFSREWFLPYHIYRGFHPQASSVSRRREFQCVTAACMLVRRDAFDQVSGFDEGYRNGFEDVDLCLKIRERQWKIVYQPQSVLYHLESRTPGRKAHEEDNGRRLRERWGASWWLADEDLIHYEDGYAIHTYITDGKLGYRTEVIADPVMKAQRMLVADAQRAAQCRDVTTVATLLAEAAEWPADAWILRWAVLLCTALGQRHLAIPFWQRILALEEDPFARLGLAKQALGSGSVDEAEFHLAALLADQPGHGEGWLLRGIVAMQRGAFQEAEEAFVRARLNAGDQRKASLGIVMAAIGAVHHEAAWLEVLPLCEQYPDDEECMHWLLRCGTVLERWDRMGALLSAFIARNPGNLSMRFALAGIWLRAGRPADARREYETLRMLNPSFDGLGDLSKTLADSEHQLVRHHAA
ncbi:MAG: glycosyltransferase [Nitrospira sp.]|nr:MAG: putative methyltransferase and glycosyltransferase [Nitrospira sp. OLB3]MCK6494407.1 glycosyltransferase [Nitrospira sp.]RIK58987.1 MAG: hypothetical protein DCC63_08590 [Nitrospira sp.]